MQYYAWSTILQEELRDLYVDPNLIFGNLNIISSRQSWYLPVSKKLQPVEKVLTKLISKERHIAS